MTRQGIGVPTIQKENIGVEGWGRVGTGLRPVGYDTIITNGKIFK